MAKKGDWVRIHRVVLPAEGRNPNLPADTAKVPLEMWVKGMSVSPYFYGSYNNHEQKRDRKLLLTRREISRLESATKQTGYTIVPTLVWIDANGRAKMDIALCKGKKAYDKRQTLKEKEDRREMDRAMKVYK